MNPPLRFCIGLHLHQPVGNFDRVFAQHLSEVYRPLLDVLAHDEIWPIGLHLSGPLLDWLEQHAHDFVDAIGRHVERGRIELLAAGHDEPILAVLPHEDRLEQIVAHREHLRRRFGVEARGLWLTERVWEPNLPEDLVAAGIRHVLVDDRHFRVSGFDADQLHQHFLTEAGGHRVAVFPIDEKLRYLIPFRPVEELSAYLRSLRASGHGLAVFADDGEKFGGWPGTRKWLYEDGWFASFVATLQELRDQGEIVLSRFEDALRATPSGGLAYLPSASYREMEGWALPPAPARALLHLEREWGEPRLDGVEGGLLRGGHWRHFLVKYPESNRMHKYMLALSQRCREQGDPPRVRRSIGRAQCNDAYWHGVFGGLYLPHLRAAIWRELAAAEAALRHDEGLALEATDIDTDGRHELWIHSARLSAIVAPERGGMVELLIDFERGSNLCDVVARHREAYHEPLPGEAGHPEHDPPDGGSPSIHDLEGQLSEPPPVDTEPRALLVDRILAATVDREDFINGTVPVLRSWARERLMETWDVRAKGVEIRLGTPGYRKTVRIDADGTLHCAWEWEASAGGEQGGWFSSELSVAEPVEITAPGAERWDYPIETVAKSERGFDRTIQGQAIVLNWPLSAGKASLTLRRQRRS